MAALIMAVLLSVPVTFACGTSDNVTVIEIQDLKFNPSEVTIKKGDTVRWVNKDQTAHTSTAKGWKSPPDDPLSWNSEPKNPGETYERTFDAVGDFEYSCLIHPYMNAKVIVED
ncbi:MAG: cupredoxin domain-containing protein [Thermoleophilia bacterium]